MDEINHNNTNICPHRTLLNAMACSNSEGKWTHKNKICVIKKQALIDRASYECELQHHV